MFDPIFSPSQQNLRLILQQAVYAYELAQISQRQLKQKAAKTHQQKLESLASEQQQISRHQIDKVGLTVAKTEQAQLEQMLTVAHEVSRSASVLIQSVGLVQACAVNLLSGNSLDSKMAIQGSATVFGQAQLAYRDLRLSLYHLAQKYLEQKDWEAARRLARSLLTDEQAPLYSEALALTIETYLQQAHQSLIAGHNDDAEGLVRQALSINPQESAVLATLKTIQANRQHQAEDRRRRDEEEQKRHLAEVEAERFACGCRMLDQMVFVPIPAGYFLYGDEKEKVYLDEFIIGKYPVTNAQFIAFVEASGVGFSVNRNPNKFNHPVSDVTWEQAHAFCTWASHISGKTYYLPSEKEWQKAARGVDGREYPWGNQPPDAMRCDCTYYLGDGQPRLTTAVGKYSPLGDSPFGCVDMAGNVWEWTADSYDHGAKLACGSLKNYGGVNPIYHSTGYLPHAGFRLCISSSSQITDQQASNVEKALQSAGDRKSQQQTRNANASHEVDIRTMFEQMKMVRVPAGKFLMGEGKVPMHVDEYLIGKYLVTNAQFIIFAEAVGYDGSINREPAKLNHPVTNISWHSAVAFCNWASQVTGKKFHLPSNIEWEKAARGTDGRIYPWGNQRLDAERCNFGWLVGTTTPVGNYSPKGDSPYGCTDMAGNVWEWTGDNYQEGYEYEKSLRGGAFDCGWEWARRISKNRRFIPPPDPNLSYTADGETLLTCTFHYRANSKSYSDTMGFRVCVSPN